MTLFQRDISLKNYNTFQIDVTSRGFEKVESSSELEALIRDNPYDELLVLGGGSNVLFTKDFQGLILQINKKGIKKVWENDKKIRLEVGAGENWHELVLWTLEENLGGLENLALIPGNVGAAPIQNIGAYGVEFNSVFYSCRVFDIANKKELELFKEECHLSYRNSIFKQQAKGMYAILSVQIELFKSPHPLNLEYGIIKSILNFSSPTIQEVAKTIISIRNEKLPDPKNIGNGGSFFKNPVISEKQFNKLQKRIPKMPHYTQSNGIKIPAAWLIEHLGFKGYRKGDAGVHHKQALVLVNFGNASGISILSLAKEIEEKVFSTFGISLEREVNVY